LSNDIIEPTFSLVWIKYTQIEPTLQPTGAEFSAVLLLALLISLEIGRDGEEFSAPVIRPPSDTKGAKTKGPA
jgi:hypothetical protein